MAFVKTDEQGHNIVEIEEIIFKGKRKIAWDCVQQYLKKYVGLKYIIEETGELIHIGSDCPDEYANSRYSAKAFGTVGKAKANASQVIPELIKNATNGCFSPNMEEKHRNNAKYGWYRWTVRFSVPICDDKGEKIGKNIFCGTMIIRHALDGEKYLYDIINIKKET